jgi:hypothetical protein
VYFHHAQIQRGTNTAIDSPPFVTDVGDGKTKQPGRADFSLPAYNNGTILITFTPQGFNFREGPSFYDQTDPRILSGGFNDTALEFRNSGIRFRNRQDLKDLSFNFENYTTYKYGITFNRPDGVTRAQIKGPNGQDKTGQIAANPQGWEKELQIGVDGRFGNVAINSIRFLSDTVTNAQLDTLTSI